MAARENLNVTTDDLAALQEKTERIRNVCIVAHVDHGKTTLSDCLISTNGIISSRSAGKIRYMDHTKEEQERGITMKSSSISLLYSPNAPTATPVLASAVAGEAQTEAASPAPEATPKTQYLVNLIDSPGHMDFSSEVSSALRICDGCVVLVDVLEGVCIQTRAVLRQAWNEKVKPVLVLNKIDRLITQLYMTPVEAYDHIVKVLQQVNVVSGSLWAEEVMKMKESAAEAASASGLDAEGAIDEDLFEKMDDSDVYFSPDRGNVIFASAIHGWGFRIDHFCDLWAKKLGVQRATLRKTLWGDFYYHVKTKKIYKKPIGKSPPMFVQFVLNNIWEVYNAVTPNRDLDKLGKIAKALGLQVSNREFNHDDTGTVIQSFMGRWLPISSAVLDVVVEQLPNPRDAQKIRIPHLWKPIPVPGHEDEITKFTNSLSLCDAAPSAPVIGFVSKVFSVPNDQLMLDMRVSGGVVMPKPRRKPGEEGAAPSTPAPAAPAPVQSQLERGGQSFIAMARLFSGELKVGDTLNIMGVRYNPALSTEKHRIEVQVPQLFLLMGRSLQPIKQVTAGQVFGIGGDAVVSQIVKTATISSSIHCPVFDVMKVKGNPIVRVAVEPVNPADMPKLEQGLKLLYLADPAVATSVLENGEFIIGALGELHLQRCLGMLEQDFAKVPIRVSPPIVSFKESITSNLSREFDSDVVQEIAERSVTVTVRARPLPQTIVNFIESREEDTRRFIERRQGTPAVEQQESILKYREELKQVFDEAGPEWTQIFSGPTEESGSRIWALGPKRMGPNLLINRIPNFAESQYWRSPVDSSVPVHLQLSEKDGKTEIIGKIESVNADGEHTTQDVDLKEPQLMLRYYFALQQIEASIRSGFQISSRAGPLCDEPMVGVAFEILNVRFHKSEEKKVMYDEFGDPIEEEVDTASAADSQKARKVDDKEITQDNSLTMAEYDTDTMPMRMSRIGGQIIGVVKAACREAFIRHEQRLVEAYYTSAVQTNAEQLGKVYAVLSKRRAKIQNEEMHEGSSIIVVMAQLPAAESFGFAEELFRKTAGSASAQLEFSHWDILDVDPSFVPTTEEELEEFGDNVGGIAPNLARKYVDGVRRRKGLAVKEKKIEGDKQRTLAKKK